MNKKQIFIVLISILFTLPIGISAQNQKVKLTGSNISLKVAFDQIEKQTGLSVDYDSKVIDIKRLISAPSQTLELKDLMEFLLNGSKCKYTINKSHIIINYSPEEQKENNSLKKITGLVTDEKGDPIIGATVLVKGTKLGTITDVNGKFLIDYDDNGGSSLIISFVGYRTMEFSVGQQKNVRIQLEENSKILDEIIVVGYGTQKKSDITGSISSIKSADVNAFSSTSVSQALQGRASGVQIQQNNGQPGSTIQVRVRGSNSIYGDNEPLWIIDGFPGDINLINTADIENIEILKDASATAIYGSRGANGVIIVTTKQAKEGNIKIEYNSSYGIQTIAKKLDLLDATGYMNYINELSIAKGGSVVFSDEQLSTLGGVGTSWQDEIFQPASIQNHSINLSGGTKKLQSTFGLSYLDQNGIILNSGYSRLTIRSSLNYDISKKISLSSNLILSRLNQDKMDSQGGSRGTSAISAALIAPPTASTKYADGSWNDFQNDPIAPMNPLAYLYEVSNKWYSTRLMANIALNIKPIDGLSIIISGNANNNNNRLDYYKTLKFPGSSGAASITFGETQDISSTNTITYDKMFSDKHHVTVMGGMTYEKSITKAVSTGTATGFLSDVTETQDIESAQNSGLPSSGYSDWALMSFLGRLNYSFDNRYLATVNFRADGSSRYSKGNKWGYFPSLALAWRLSQESFLKDVRWLSDLKFRIGYGVTGSTAISPYSTLNTLSSQYAVFNKDNYIAYAPSDQFTGDLKWETTSQTNVGLDLALLNNRIRFTADYYYKKTTDLLNEVEMPRSSGYTTALRNIGSIQNQGVELAIDTRIIDSQFKWDLAFNFSLNRSKVLDLADGNDIYGSTLNNTILNDQLNLIRVGEPMCVFYGYKEDGYDENGNIIYKDLDGDGQITTADKTIIGNPNPDYLFNINTSFAYKNWSLSLFFQSSIGNDIYSLSMAAEAYDYNYNGNTLTEVANNHWTPDNINAKYPALTQTSYKMSDRFVYDGSYLRLKDVNLSYLIPVSKIKWLQKAQVYLSAQNILTITRYPFWDPDVNAYGGGNSIVQGVDSYNYPSARTFTGGIKLTF